MEKLWAPWRVEYIRKGSASCFLCESLRKKDQTEALILEKGSKAFIIMNRYPYNNGHLMVAPCRHAGLLESLDDEELLEINRLLVRAIKALNRTVRPHGFNMGINQGQVAGAGLVTHIHFHLVPRWQGDTNFMPCIGETKVISEGLLDTYKKIREGLTELNRF